MTIPPEQDRGMSKEARELASYYDENYEIAARVGYTNPPHSAVRLGVEVQPRRCRYCGNSDTNGFRTVAHAIPECIGNRFVVSVDECDKCNAFFAAELDNHFANFLGLRRTLWQVRGKKGVPTYAIPGRSPRLWVEQDNSFRAEGKFEDGFFQISPDGRSGKIIGRRPPYKPRAAFKCLVKSALALMPAADLTHYAGLFRWIREGTSDAGKYMAFTSWSEVKRVGFEALLLRRSHSHGNVPYYSFLLSFSNITIQIFLPYSTADAHLRGSEVRVRRLPNAAERFGYVAYHIEDLSSDDLERDHKDEISFEILEPAQIARLDGAPLGPGEAAAALAKITVPPHSDGTSD